MGPNVKNRRRRAAFRARSVSGARQGWAAVSWAPVVEVKSCAWLDLELYVRSAFYGVTAGSDGSNGINRMSPRLSVNQERTTLTTVVIFDHKVGFSVGRGHCLASELSLFAARERGEDKTANKRKHPQHFSG